MTTMQARVHTCILGLCSGSDCTHISIREYTDGLISAGSWLKMELPCGKIFSDQARHKTRRVTTLLTEVTCMTMTGASQPAHGCAPKVNSSNSKTPNMNTSDFVEYCLRVGPQIICNHNGTIYMPQPARTYAERRVTLTPAPSTRPAQTLSSKT